MVFTATICVNSVKYLFSIGQWYSPAEWQRKVSQHKTKSKKDWEEKRKKETKPKNPFEP